MLDDVAGIGGQELQVGPVVDRGLCLGRGEDDLLIRGPTGHQAPLDQDLAVTDFVVVPVDAPEFDCCPGQDGEGGAPLDGDDAAQLDLALPDRVAADDAVRQQYGCPAGCPDDDRRRGCRCVGLRGCGHRHDLAGGNGDVVYQRPLFEGNRMADIALVKPVDLATVGAITQDIAGNDAVIPILVQRNEKFPGGVGFRGIFGAMVQVVHHEHRRCQGVGQHGQARKGAAVFVGDPAPDAGIGTGGPVGHGLEIVALDNGHRHKGAAVNLGITGEFEAGCLILLNFNGVL